MLEACLYARNLEEAARFYAEVIGLHPFASERGRHVFFRTGADAVFLLFNPDRTRQAADSNVGIVVPAHGASGAGHVAFAIREADLSAWRARFAHHGVEIEAEVTWPRGGRSIYVRDPAGNSVELATPSLWGFGEAREGGS